MSSKGVCRTPDKHVTKRGKQNSGLQVTQTFGAHGWLARCTVLTRLQQATVCRQASPFSLFVKGLPPLSPDDPHHNTASLLCARSASRHRHNSSPGDRPRCSLQRLPCRGAPYRCKALVKQITVCTAAGKSVIAQELPQAALVC